ncbi:histone acetyltransferase type B catalytic subunit-like isoform X1 [Oscarella lobularis]|uniref:histone acetyltransferase type B catalytic subunit-like isoform X1 n=1 Tax=Oscarella lobularis TaxID=121494 RepID=UPI0033142220
MAIAMENLDLVKEKASEFLADANECTHLKLVKTEGDVLDDAIAFHPDMSHQLFGESEMIFGYSEPRIDIYFGAATLNTYLNFSYKAKVTSKNNAFLKDVQPDSVIPKLAEKLPSGFCTNRDEFIASLAAESSFVPFGRQVNSYETTTESSPRQIHYEIYQSDTLTPRLRQFHERLQIFLLWYIDAASYIDVDDEKWRFFFLFEKDLVDGRTSYSIVAYATVYQYFAYPDKIRPRIRYVWNEHLHLEGHAPVHTIYHRCLFGSFLHTFRTSQFLVLPPFQRKGHGARLLQTIYDFYISDDRVRDITVEDQSDEFSYLRNYVDCCNCLDLKSFRPDALQAGFDDEMIAEATEKLKLVKSQTRRVYEILRLRATNRGDPDAYRKYRLDVKNRLNKPFQRKQAELKKLERVLNPNEMTATAIAGAGVDERHQQLASMYESLETSYMGIIEKLATL